MLLLSLSQLLLCLVCIEANTRNLLPSAIRLLDNSLQNMRRLVQFQVSSEPCPGMDRSLPAAVFLFFVYFSQSLALLFACDFKREKTHSGKKGRGCRCCKACILRPVCQCLLLCQQWLVLIDRHWRQNSAKCHDRACCDLGMELSVPRCDCMHLCTHTGGHLSLLAGEEV